MPRLTQPEWDLVALGLQQLADTVRAEVYARVEEAAALQGAKTCPFLDRDAGSCLIYEHRPVACRTYGFYVERDRGLYCRSIEEEVDGGRMSNVVWGNVAAVEASLAAYGEKISLSDWLRAVPAPVPTRSSDSPGPDAAR